MKRVFAILTLVLLLVSLAGAIFAIRSTEMSHIQWALPFVLLFWLFLFGLWYLAFGSPRFLRRLAHFGIATLLFVVVSGVLAGLLEYDGSSSGSSFPKFRWVWQTGEEGRAEILERGLVRGELSPEEAALSDAASDTADFLGPGRDGTFETLAFGTDWEKRPPELLWRRPIGKAWSSFSVVGRRAITQEQAGDSERVVCLDLFTGEELWHHEDPGVRLLEVRKENTGARMGGDGPRATPVVTGDRVFAYGSTGILNCLDLSTGEEIWEVRVLEQFRGGIQKWGMAGSPLLLGPEGLVVVSGSDNPGVTLVALRQEDGTEAWRYEDIGASYSSPRVIEILGHRQIVSINRETVTGHDPATGERLWREEWPGTFPKVAQPILVGDDRILATASYGAGSLLLRLALEGDSWSVETLWKTTRLKTKFSSPVILGEHAYGIDEGRLAGIHLSDGTKAWKYQKVGFGQQLLVGDHLLIQTEPGPVIVGPVTPEGFVEKGRIEALSDMTWNAPTLAGRILLVRNDREAVCYLLPAPE